MLEGKLILVKLLQPEKHQSPNEVMLDGKLILVKLLQREKHQSPNDVILDGKLILVKLLHILYLLLVDYQCYTI